MPEFCLTAEDECVPLDVLEYMAAALDLQMRRDVAPRYDVGEIWTVGALPSLDDLVDAPGVRKVLRFRRKLDVGGALAFHTRNRAGIEYAEALAPSLMGSTIDATASGHEVIETFADPGCNMSWPMPDGSRVDFEIVDPVERDWYPITVVLGRESRVVRVPDFVTPAWFGLGDGPVDFLGVIKVPFTLRPGGYFRRVDIDGSEEYVYADRAARDRIEEKQANGTSRLARRRAA